MTIATRNYSAYRQERFLLLAYLLLLVLLNTVAFLWLSVGDESTKVSGLFVSKEGVIPFLSGLALLSWVNRRRTDRMDLLIISLILLTVVITFINGASAQIAIERIRFFIFPMLLILIGKHFFRNLTFPSIRSIFIIIAVFTCIISIIYYGVFICREDLLLEGNITKIYETKNANAALWHGFQANFYTLINPSHEVKRIFGPFFDPLALGFFLVPFLFLCRYELKQRTTFRLLMLYVVLICLLLLSFTRSIIIAYFFTCFAIRIRDRHVGILSTKWIIIALALVTVVLVFYFDEITLRADPSSWGHLNAYADRLNLLISSHPRDILLGQRIAEGSILKSESLFVTILLQNGVLYLFLFFVFIFMAASRLRRQIESPLNLIVFSSLFVYLLASLTTEHFFATTSCAVFWILLGISLGNRQRFTNKMGLQKDPIVVG